MKALYVETSALLAWLLGEPQAVQVRKNIDQAEEVFTSVLTLIEARRAMIRLQHESTIREAEIYAVVGLLQKTLQTWSLMEITPNIQERASRQFLVEPIRSLDAIHLATALELMKAYVDLSILSFDQRILANAKPLGLRIA